MSYATQHLNETARVVAGLDDVAIERMVALLAPLPARAGGGLLVGVGGGGAKYYVKPEGSG